MRDDESRDRTPDRAPGAAARRKVATFLVLTFLLSSVIYYLVTTSFAVDTMQTLFALLMWCPGVSAIATRLVYQRNLNGFGSSWGERRWLALGMLLPVGMGLVMFAPVWLSGIGSFNGANAMGLLSIKPLIVLVVTIIVTCLAALGEELGWRGLLVPEMSKFMTFTRVGLITGAIWALWHYPMILFGPYHGAGSAWFSLLIFTPEVIAVGFVLAWLRMRSGSLWVTVLFHGFWNYFIQAFYPALTIETSATAGILGEFGWAALVVTVPLALICWHYRRSLPGAGRAGTSSVEVSSH